MDLRSDHPNLAFIPLYSTTTYPCNYLPGKVARAQIAVLGERLKLSDYSFLIQHGFRRSGAVTYRPQCPECNACLSVRVLVNEMRYSRSQQRALKRHGNLCVRLLPLQYIPAHFALYQRYQEVRHADNNMAQTGREQYEAFILHSHVNSFLAEFRDEHQVRCVSLVDQVDDGLSIVYTFFDPDMPRASLGVYSILWLAQQARQTGLSYLYLGYWISACQKMAYKINYQPLEGFHNDRWERLPLAKYKP